MDNVLREETPNIHKSNQLTNITRLIARNGHAIPVTCFLMLNSLGLRCGEEEEEGSDDDCQFVHVSVGCIFKNN